MTVSVLVGRVVAPLACAVLVIIVSGVVSLRYSACEPTVAANQLPGLTWLAVVAVLAALPWCIGGVIRRKAWYFGSVRLR